MSRSVLVLLAGSALLLLAPSSTAQAPFLETGGLVVIEAETELVPGGGHPDGWRLMPDEADSDHPAFPGATGGRYLQWDDGNNYGNPGQGTMAFPVRISQAGTYRFQWRSKVGFGSNATEHNDSWLKIDADAFYGEKGNGSIVCPKGYDPAQNDCTGDVPNGSGSGGWFKAYSSGTTDWTWSTRTSDNDAHDLFARFDAPGTYTVRVSGRSDGHLLDRLVLYHSSVGSGDALDLDNPESPRDGDSGGGDVVVEGELKRWHPVSLTFTGPDVSESDSANPFLRYRLNVAVTAPSGAVHVVPGFFAADGDAAETSAAAGDQWRAIYTPAETGTHTFAASFREGTDVAVSLSPGAGTPTAFDGLAGSFAVGETDKSAPDFRGRGVLRYVGEHYLRFDDGSYFIKGGADSPENFLGYYEFDNTQDNGGSGNDLTDGLHRYDPHLGDWQSGDPTWQGGKGKRIVGAVNYLASEGVNSQYFITMNVQGDGREVYPWTAYGERRRFDVSKLAQWDVVLRHMTARGVKLHVLTQETENDQLLNGGDLGTERKLYYRELVARFGYHPALVWNLGEENTNTDAQRRAFADYVRALDPYAHPIVVHTYPGDHEAVFGPLLGFPNLDGPSLQLGGMNNGYGPSEEWVRRSADAGRPWVVTLDEPGNATVGCSPDGAGNNHRACRGEALWANLFAGGAGVEWYFGYSRPHNDLDLEDFRSRDRLWDYTRYAVSFMHDHLPFTEMATVRASSVGADGDTYLFAQDAPDDGWFVAAVYLPDGTDAFDIPAGTYTVAWFDPRNGGALQSGSVPTVSEGADQSLGTPPGSPSEDWVALLTRTDAPDAPNLSIAPGTLNFGAVEVGETVTRTLGLRNTGTAPLTVQSLALGGPDAADFELATDPSPVVLGPGGEAAAEVAFSPSSEGGKSATLRIASDDPDTPTTTVALTGAGGSASVAVASFTLVDADTDEDVGPLADGDRLVVGEMPAHINVRANTVPAVVGSVRFRLNDDANYQTENSAPYALAGDAEGDYNPWTPAPGAYELTATPFEGANASGGAGTALAITFTVAAATDVEPEDVSDRVVLLQAAPNPLRDRATVRFRLPASVHTHVAVYTLLGERVAVLVDGVLASGLHTVPFRAGSLPSGVYLLRVATARDEATRKLVLIR
ncbi:MAG: choice-of-anchor D domain-containing protein [Bacteroidota bacterium]